MLELVESDQSVIIEQQPAEVLEIETEDTQVLELSSGTQGQPGPKGDPGDASAYDDLPSFSLLFENALI